MLYTGFREIDDKLGGIENGELVLFSMRNLKIQYIQVTA